jgi:hypothetical protein
MTKNTLPKSVTDGVEGPSWVNTLLASRIANVKRGADGNLPHKSSSSDARHAGWLNRS